MASPGSLIVEPNRYLGSLRRTVKILFILSRSIFACARSAAEPSNTDMDDDPDDFLPFPNNIFILTEAIRGNFLGLLIGPLRPTA